MEPSKGGGGGHDLRPGGKAARRTGSLVFLAVAGALLSYSSPPVAADATFNLRINKYYYLIQTSWGTPAQDLYLALDLGSQDLWVYGGMCWVISKKCTQGTNNYYRHINSTTYSARSGTYTLDYDTIYQFNGSVRATTGNDRLAVGSNSLGTLDFAIVNEAEWSIYKRVNMSGILGLGLQSLTGINGYLSTLLGMGSANGNRNLTLYTNRNTSTGVLTIGRPDSTRCSSSWTYLPTVTPDSSHKYWEVSLGSFRFGTYATGSLSGHTAIFSTLVSYMLVPPDVFQQIRPRVRQVVFDYSWSHNLVDCGERDRYPDMSFTIGGRVFNITPWEYIWETHSKFCILKIQPNAGSKRWVFGYPFHQGHCEHYDFSSSTLGLTTRL